MNTSLPDDLTRIEDVSNDEMNEQLVEMTHAVYPHKRRFGDAFTLEKALPLSADQVFQFLAQADNLPLWSSSLRLVDEAAIEKAAVVPRLPATDEDETGQQERPLLFTDHYSGECFRLEISAYPASGVIDLHWFHAEGDDAQLCIFSDAIRILNAQQPLNSQGCILLWVCAPGQSLMESVQNQSDTVVNWHSLPARRKIEMDNIHRIVAAQADQMAGADPEVSP